MVKTATKAERQRWSDMRDIGCIACWQIGYYGVPPDMHHLINGYRIGHSATVALCEWHHRGIPRGGVVADMCRRGLGPSLAEHSREFHERFGSDEELLALQEQLLEKHRARIVGRA